MRVTSMIISCRDLNRQPPSKWCCAQCANATEHGRRFCVRWRLWCVGFRAMSLLLTPAGQRPENRDLGLLDYELDAIGYWRNNHWFTARRFQGEWFECDDANVTHRVSAGGPVRLAQRNGVVFMYSVISMSNVRILRLVFHDKFSRFSFCC